MSKSLKIVIVVIGILSLVAGVYSLMNGNTTNAYFGVFVGVILMGSALLVGRKGKR